MFQRSPWKQNKIFISKWIRAYRALFERVRGSAASSRKSAARVRVDTESAGYLNGSETLKKHTFSAFWLRSSVVSVLISLISGTSTNVGSEY